MRLSDKINSGLEKFGPLSLESLEMLSSIFKEKRLNKGDFFSQYLDKDKRIAIIVSGVFRQYYASENGDEHNQAFYVDNDLICTRLDSTNSNSSNIQSLTESNILEADYTKFKKLSENYKDIDKLHKNYLYYLVENKQRREQELLSKTGSQRYLEFMQKYNNLVNIIPHYHIASYLGITPTQLSRIRNKN